MLGTTEQKGKRLRIVQCRWEPHHTTQQQQLQRRPFSRRFPRRRALPLVRRSSLCRVAP